MNLREAAQMALEALEYPGNIWHMNCPKDKAITALRAALAEPAVNQQLTAEPVAWHHPECEGACIACLIESAVQEAYGSQGLAYLQRHLVAPLRTHWEGCEAVHPECRKQGPVAWELRVGKTDRFLMEITNNPERAQNWRARRCEVVPLYYAPTPRKPQPLTDEEMRECAQAMNAEPLAEGWPELIKFARAIERAALAKVEASK